ncbi:pyridoxamine 5'-phosphate oxidase family protein [Shimia sp. MMG029]|uniref:pyridoxamine 5'-phosphate oxidase family protein n=1 Tax=Shimia sp. MMG029 TaxID=3021978 RepID=UPI0022FEB3D4|nr:pyridoxamine 5'-phosphate oxidase family protein [Shimia sp. MMG029]MDA5557747.1 pyridoxamine 5'-phosphate oxidase family protein [Shimia sp. MMG029]
MINKFARDLIENWHLGFVATADTEGNPNVSPKGSFVIHDDITISFAEIRSPDTLANIKVRPQLEVNFIDILTRRGVLIQGEASFVAREDARYPSLRPPYTTRWPELEPEFSGFVVINVTACKPLATPAYDIGVTSEDLRAKWMQRVRDINIIHKGSEDAEC